MNFQTFQEGCDLLCLKRFFMGQNPFCPIPDHRARI